MDIPLGTRVRFHGTADEDGKMLSAKQDGPDTFEATVHSYPYGLCYGLRFDDGSPVGLPFHDEALEVI